MDPVSSFHVGDKVVYPNHGVGVIEHIATRADAGGAEQSFYLLKIEASNLRVMVPTTNADTVGMRRLCAAGELGEVLHFLEHGEVAAAVPDWKFRFKENSEKMRQGALLQVAQVLKSLLRLHQTKPLSFREKKMLDRAAALLVSELGTAAGLAPDVALTQLRAALAKASLELPPPEQQ